MLTMLMTFGTLKVCRFASLLTKCITDTLALASECTSGLCQKRCVVRDESGA